jgi:hypothetical protein
MNFLLPGNEPRKISFLYQIIPLINSSDLVKIIGLLERSVQNDISLKRLLKCFEALSDLMTKRASLPLPLDEALF